MSEISPENKLSAFIDEAEAFSALQIPTGLPEGPAADAAETETYETAAMVGRAVGRALLGDKWAAQDLKASISMWLREHELYQQANFDHQTGLHNRRSFDLVLRERLQRAEASGAEGDVGVLFLDLDGFKRINDTLGHKKGDQVISTIGSAFRGLVRQSDIAARWAAGTPTRREDLIPQGMRIGRRGGDEFIFLVDLTMPIRRARKRPLSPEGRLLLVGDRLRHAVRTTSEHPSLGLGNLRLGASVGISIWRPGISPDELVRMADDAMYEAKAKKDQAGGAPIVIYSSGQFEEYYS